MTNLPDIGPNTHTSTTFGSALAAARKLAGITTGQLATATGYRVDYLQRLERGLLQPPPPAVARRITTALPVEAAASLTMLARPSRRTNGPEDEWPAPD